MSEQLPATAAALLESGRTLDLLSRPLTVLAFAGLLAPAFTHVGVVALGALLLSGVAGLFQAYAAMRVAFDAALFRGLAGGGDLVQLDQALLQARLLPPAKAGRKLPERIAGGRKLLRWQGLALAAQAAGLLAAGLVPA